MIALAALVRLPASVVAALGVADDRRPQPARRRALGAIRSGRSCTRRASCWPTPPHLVFVAYPLVPWIGVTAVGYGLGQVYAWAAERRREFLVAAGAGPRACVRRCCARSTSTATRALDGAADGAVHRAVVPEHDQVPAVAAVPADDARAGAAAARARSTGARRACCGPALVIGRVPLFYYVLHFCPHPSARRRRLLRALRRRRTGCSSRPTWTTTRLRRRPGGDSVCRSSI